MLRGWGTGRGRRPSRRAARFRRVQLGTPRVDQDSQAIAAVVPALHRSASAAFNTSRQIGAAIGIATFGPLLGTVHDLGDEFIICLLAGCAATSAALLLTATTWPAIVALSQGGTPGWGDQEPSLRLNASRHARP